MRSGAVPGASPWVPIVAAAGMIGAGDEARLLRTAAPPPTASTQVGDRPGASLSERSRVTVRRWGTPGCARCRARGGRRRRGCPVPRRALPQEAFPVAVHGAGPGLHSPPTSRELWCSRSWRRALPPSSETAIAASDPALRAFTTFSTLPIEALDLRVMVAATSRLRIWSRASSPGLSASISLPS